MGSDVLVKPVSDATEAILLRDELFVREKELA